MSSKGRGKAAQEGAGQVEQGVDSQQGPQQEPMLEVRSLLDSFLQRQEQERQEWREEALAMRRQLEQQLEQQRELIQERLGNLDLAAERVEKPPVEKEAERQENQTAESGQKQPVEKQSERQEIRSPQTALGQSGELSVQLPQPKVQQPQQRAAEPREDDDSELELADDRVTFPNAEELFSVYRAELSQAGFKGKMPDKYLLPVRLQEGELKSESLKMATRMAATAGVRIARAIALLRKASRRDLYVRWSGIDELQEAVTELDVAAQTLDAQLKMAEDIAVGEQQTVLAMLESVYATPLPYESGGSLFRREMAAHAQRVHESIAKKIDKARAEKAVGALSEKRQPQPKGKAPARAAKQPFRAEQQAPQPQHQQQRAKSPARTASGASSAPSATA